MRSVGDLVGVELLDDDARRAARTRSGRRRSTSRAARRPRRTGSRVVEAVGHLVADDGADAAVVHRVVGVGVEERRLQDPGREDDLVAERVVVGVHDVGGHRPLGPVHRRAELSELAAHLEGGGLQTVPDEARAVELEARVVAPFVRIADLVAEARELGECLLPGGVRHPVVAADRPLHRVEQVLHELLAAGLRRRRERLRDEQLGDRLADARVGRGHHALPAGLLRLLAAQDPAVEGEVLVLERGRQRGRARAHEMPAQGARRTVSSASPPARRRPPRRSPGCRRRRCLPRCRPRAGRRPGASPA